MWNEDIVSGLIPYTWNITICTYCEEWLHLGGHIDDRFKLIWRDVPPRGTTHATWRFFLHNFWEFVSGVTHLGGD
jgi:hypothetical protein